MSVKIYDSTIGAFKDAETPKIWDEQAQAYKDSVGLVRNESEQAWEERWSPYKNLYLYSKGIIETEISGGLRKASNCTYAGESCSNGTVTFNSNNIYIGAPAGQQEGLLITNNKIDLSKYNKLFVTISNYNGSGGSTHHVHITQYDSGEIYSNSKGVFVGTISLTANFENEIDISQYSDVAYLYFVIGGGNFMNITDIRLE